MEENIYRPISNEPMAELQRQINLYREAAYAYYNTGDTIMSDEDFDNLRQTLINKGMDLSAVGAPIIPGENRKHTFPMLSLGKVPVKEYEMDFTKSKEIVNKLRRFQPDITDSTPILATFKLDGCGIDLLYEGGLLVDAITRGNGTEGKSVFKKMYSRLPIKLKDSNFTGSLRGEFVMKKSTFIAKYADDYKNPRNLVSGILGDQTLDDERVQDVDLLLYSVNGLWHISEQMETVKLPKQFLHTPTKAKISNIKSIYNKFRDCRNDFEYPTDGIVLQLINPEKFIGDSHEPYHMIAVKFPPVRTKTKIKYVELNLRKSGEYIPKLILEPVDVDGSTVSQCAAYNWGYIMEYGLLPGAEIEIGKNGDIIPYVQSVITPASFDTCNVVTYPSENAEIVLGEGDKLPKDSYISGVHCFKVSGNSAKIKRERFIQQCRRLEIKGFGWSTFNNLYDMVEGNFIELFNPINMQDAILAEYISGKATRRKWVSAIKEIKENMTLYWFIGMMSFPNVGWAVAEQAARKASHVDYNFSGLDRSVVDNLFNGSYAKELGIAIQAFKQYGGKIEPFRPKIENYEATYEMTGTPNVEGFKTKEDIKKKLFKWEHTSLNKNTTYLITNDKMSKTNKMKKAEANGTIILTYAEAIALHDNK